MTRELWLLRHGKSDWDSAVESDFDRPLAKRGRRAVKRISVWMREHDRSPDVVVSSPARRARHTAIRLCKRIGRAVEAIVYEPAIYEAGVPALLEVLASRPAHERRVLLVGHNPGLEDLVLYLTAGRARPGAGGKLMPTAALARLQLPDDWADLGSGAAISCEIVRPRELDL